MMQLDVSGNTNGGSALPRRNGFDPADLMAVDALVAVPDGLLGKWWVAHTRARHEKALYDDLARMGIFSYLPLTQRVTRSPRTRRLSKAYVPVFTGYLFFNGDDDARYRAMTTNHIASTLVVPNQLELLSELRNIHRVLAVGAGFEQTQTVKAGDWVRVTVGPLEGVEGVVAQWRPRLRMELNVHILGQSVSVEVDAAMVEKIDPPSYTGDGMARSQRSS
ncbi:MAG TPA: transcription termination/antitermination NusG family protein [Phycisphaerae bacterium]